MEKPDPVEFARELAQTYLACALQAVQDLAGVLGDCQWKERREYRDLECEIEMAQDMLENIEYDINSVFRVDLRTDDDCESPSGASDQDSDYPTIPPPSDEVPDGNALITDFFLSAK